MSSDATINGYSNPEKSQLHRADEVEDLVDAVKSLIIPFIRDADNAVSTRASGSIGVDAQGAPGRNVLVDSHKPEELVKKLEFSIPDNGTGKEGLLDVIQTILRYSVNTWDQGFMDKLYSAINPVGVASDLLLTALNTNVHIFKTSPALTIIEKTTSRKLANLFGFTGPRAGGITCPGGSASNMTSLVIARATLFPDTKDSGNANHAFALFTSAHGHYSVSKAAMTCGIGSDAVTAVAVDANGCMLPSALRAAILEAKEAGKTPLYINATAGTTVWGSYDPFTDIAAVAREFGIWLHIDGSWGGPAVFSSTQRHKLAGSELADSITVNPHKMLNVPIPCSFLITNDVAVFQRANALRAGYLFHDPDAGGEVWDLADLGLQCGRRGDALNLALAWVFYGDKEFERKVDGAFSAAAYLATLVQESDDFVLLSSNPPPCLQVCFYYAPGGVLAGDAEENTRRTREIVERLVPRGFMVDYAPGERGSLFRVVVNCSTLRSTVEGLFRALREAGREVVPE
ncbi:glutamate decarboxylase [Annulohypoxylon maeteangense]|uniref:glutamate decarboxylase n=1 Tax=Annulohypoxylon maeteangense TaxID=1927788 RepID=UPI002007BEDE|nr:glutamate decarboxylase [Annulohypoxylon maeteangense]KAI0886848.1 glutamate decarboxylase [Annulohypoxylon maeteangense]